MRLPDPDAVPRRRFLRAAVAVGGSAALAACLDAGTEQRDDLELSLPEGQAPATLPDRQHAWNEFLETDEDGNVRPPEHHVLLSLRLTSEDGDAARTQVEAALQSLERSVEWGTDGLLFTVGYSPAYFDRFDESLPASVDLPAPEPLTALENPDHLDLDDDDAVLHLASDEAAAVLAAEQALFGERDAFNGHELEATVEDVFERSDRRTGFVGPGLPAEKQAAAAAGDLEMRGLPDADIPAEAPFWMGFRSGFRTSQATEDRVTIQSGPFAGGATEHVESLRVQLQRWFDQDTHERRVALMFSPEHDEDDVGTVGENLGASTGAAAVADRTREHARDEGVVGHAQKAARARENGQPPLLRRDFNSTDDGFPGVHFLSLQRDVSTFVRVREAMAGDDLTDAGPGRRHNNGILDYVTVQRRGNFLVPPREHRALPTPTPE